MKKKYSDPLMFASRSILMTIPITNSQSGHISEGDDDWVDDDGAKSRFSINSYSGVPASEDPVTIVNPVEEAVTSASTSATTGVTAGATIESSVEAVSTSPLEVESVIDEIVPEVTEEAATAGTTY